jgi:hypothetical protein
MISKGQVKKELPIVEIRKLIRIEGDAPDGVDPNVWGLIAVEIQLTRGGKESIKRYPLEQILLLKGKAKFKGFTIVNAGTPNAFLRRNRGQLVDLPTEFVKAPKEDKVVPVESLSEGESSYEEEGDVEVNNDDVYEVSGHEGVDGIDEVIVGECNGGVEITFEEVLRLAEVNGLILIGGGSSSAGEVQYLLEPQIISDSVESRYYLRCFTPYDIYHIGERVPVMLRGKTLIASFGGRVAQKTTEKLYIIIGGEVPNEILGASNLVKDTTESLAWYSKFEELGVLQGTGDMYILSGLSDSPIKIGKENKDTGDNNKERKQIQLEIDTYKVLSKYLYDVSTYFKATNAVGSSWGDGKCHEIYSGLGEDVIEAIVEAGVDVVTRVYDGGIQGKGESSGGERGNYRILKWVSKHGTAIDDYTFKQLIKDLEGVGVSKETQEFTAKVIEFLSELTLKVREVKDRGTDGVLDERTSGIMGNIRQKIADKVQGYKEEMDKVGTGK